MTWWTPLWVGWSKMNPEAWAPSKLLKLTTRVYKVITYPQAVLFKMSALLYMAHFTVFWVHLSIILLYVIFPLLRLIPTPVWSVPSNLLSSCIWVLLSQWAQDCRTDSHLLFETQSNRTCEEILLLHSLSPRYLWEIIKQANSPYIWSLPDCGTWSSVSTGWFWRSTETSQLVSPNKL